MTDVLIKRELLERLAEWDQFPHKMKEALTELRAILTSQPQGGATQFVHAVERESVNVVGWLGGNGLHAEERMASGAPFQLMTVAQHQRIADDFIVELDLANARNMTLRTDLAAARLQTAMMVVCAKNLADERDALLATIELMQSKQELIGYSMRSSLKPLMDDTMPDWKHIRIGVDHRVCWEDDTPYDNLIPLYVIGDV